MKKRRLERLEAAVIDSLRAGGLREMKPRSDRPELVLICNLINHKITAVFRFMEDIKEIRVLIRVQGMLWGQIQAALGENPEHSWIFKDEKGDKIPVEDRPLARKVAQDFAANLQEQRNGLLQILERMKTST